ncbi:MAG TPA: 4Fe-4S binding protein [Bacilli bacterium]|nr:4Fe-4S binding protein [Bacilli bacterium]
MRKWSEGLIFLAYFFVPFFNLFRIDIPSGTYYWMTMRFPFAHAMPLLLTVLFLVFLVVGLNFFRPRMFCSHFCPHGTVSQWLRKLQHYKLDIPLAVLITPVIAFTLLIYFVDPSTAWQAITHGESTILITAFLVLCLFIGLLVIRLRQKFCANACPYGFFQNLLTPETTSTGKKVAVSLILLVLAGAMTATALLTPRTEISLGIGARMKTGADTMTYTYTLKLANNMGEPETFIIKFGKLHPVGNSFSDPVVVPAGEEKVLPFAFQVQKATEVDLNVCAEKDGTCQDFDFTLSGQ